MWKEIQTGSADQFGYTRIHDKKALVVQLFVEGLTFES